ncbi:EAL domain-containing protein [Tumebacillus sp. ITR2]|uniref:EAL domain-containing protein n=1 Tax=Tumebacillus amylolyticus TaxID=2801339 RepID=A0ABS1J649_9BACL|nr:EAL domain-containing protein [Tumebacillus amylolyticus]MBL0385757.1 EAL domain-containing protein [Tumebacillus amylolyticus]
MSLYYMLSILIRSVATVWTISAVRRFRDWRLVTVATAVGSVLVYQLYLLFVWYLGDAWRWTGSKTDTYWLMDSVFTTLAVFYVVKIIGEQRVTEQRLKDKEQLYRSLFEHNQDAVYTMDIDGRFLTSNPACERVMGYSLEALQSKGYANIIVPEDIELVVQNFRSAVQGEATEFECRTLKPDGGCNDFLVKFVPMYINGEIVGVYGIGKDITKQKLADERVRKMAFYDVLTDLPNRVLFEQRLDQELERARTRGQMLAVMFFDLDRFKFINDTFGHGIGDRLLQAVSERLMTTVEADAIFSRISGDEFTALLPNVKDVQEVTEAAQQVIQTLQRPFVLDGNEIFITSSIGISLYPNDGSGAEQLVRHADTAMYRAKENGRNNYQLFQSAMNKQVTERLALEHDLRKALEREEFVVYYQPQVNSSTGIVFGLEALVRWQHPTRGMVSPAEFIPLAEESGLIVPIGEWVLRKSCEQVKSWQRVFPNLRAAVNLSARQFQSDDLVETVARVLRETELDAHCLDLEITESTTMHNVDRAISTMHGLKQLGIQISLDDFGTGYSSLSYLKHFPIHMLKIDRSFVRDITTDEDDASIVASVIAMAHSLNLHVIAEGVETEEQLGYLMERGCDQMQGYLFSPPLPVEKCDELLHFINKTRVGSTG